MTTDRPEQSEGKTQAEIHRELITNETQVHTEKGRENRHWGGSGKWYMTHEDIDYTIKQTMTVWLFSLVLSLILIKNIFGGFLTDSPIQLNIAYILYTSHKYKATAAA